MNSFATYYIEANVVCILVFAVLLLHNRFNLDRQEKQIKFDHALLMFIGYFLMDCFWAAIVDGILPKTRSHVVLNAFMLYVFMVATAYAWLDYVMAYEQAPHRNRPINRFAVAFPFGVATFGLILNYILAPDKLIDPVTLETTSSYAVYLVMVPDVYIIAILLYAIRKARHEENPIDKRQHLFVGLFPLMTVVGGLIESVFAPRVPIYCFTCMILMLLFYIQSSEIRVSVDPLTQLNNRGQLVRYISQSSNLYMEGRRTYVIMMDIDGFKGINDTYGHAEGDRALVVVSDALKKVLSSHSTPSFLGRYGGDEFILITHPIEEEEVGRLIEEIRDTISEMVKAADFAYAVPLSAGADELQILDSIQSCILRADEKMYQDKAARKQLRTTA